VTKKIINLVKQLEPGEKQALFEHIQRQYIREEKDGMLRDDIAEKITQLLQQDFSWIEEELIEETDLQAVGLDKDCITTFGNILLQEFDLDYIEFSKVMEWTTVKDIVSYIEDALESRGE